MPWWPQKALPVEVHAKGAWKEVRWTEMVLVYAGCGVRVLEVMGVGEESLGCESGRDDEGGEPSCGTCPPTTHSHRSSHSAPPSRQPRSPEILGRWRHCHTLLNACMGSRLPSLSSLLQHARASRDVEGRCSSSEQRCEPKFVCSAIAWRRAQSQRRSQRASNPSNILIGGARHPLHAALQRGRYGRLR